MGYEGLIGMDNAEGYTALFFGAHPDDVEIGAGGTVAWHTRLGRKTLICDLTAGELSSNGDRKSREREATSAAAVLGVTRFCLGLKDRGLRDNEKSAVSEIVRVLREYRPLLVFSPWHGDHHFINYL